MKNGNKLSRFNLGLIISLALTLVAFEWKSYSNYIFKDIIPSDEVYPIEDDWIPVLCKITRPPPPLPKKDNVDFKIVEKIEKLILNPDKPEIIPEKYEAPEIKWVEPDIPPDDPIYFAPEVNPSFLGGEKALYKYLYERIDYSKICREAGVEGTVYVNFIVESDGSISNVKVLRGIDQCKFLNREVLNAVKNMPAWSPAKQGINTVRFNMTLPVKFTLRP